MPSFCLSGKGLQNINWELLNDDFTFVIDEPFASFSTNKLLADFISPIVASLHLTEITFSEYHIKKGDPETFSKILSLLKGEKVEFDFQSLNKVYEIAKSIGNQEIICFVETQFKEPLSIDNVIERIIDQAKNHRFIDQKLVDFAALNICEISRKKLFQLNVDILSMIISSHHLSIFSEDYLFDLICDLFTLNQDNADLFQYIIFSNLKEESISKFTILVPFEFVSSRIWSSLSSLFSKSTNSTKVDRSSYCKQERYKSMFFDYSEINEFKSIPKSSTDESQNKEEGNSINCPIDLNSLQPYNDLFIQNDQLIEMQSNDQVLSQNEVNNNINESEITQNKFNGIINYLTNKYDGNVNKLNIIEITSSGVNKNHPIRNVDWIVEYKDESHYFQSNNEPNAWICFDFKDMAVSPTKYAIKSRPDFGFGSDHLKSWVVEGSNDKTRWTILDEKENADELNGANAESVFRMNLISEKAKYFKYLRIRSTGPMWSGFYNMTVASVEFYGFLIGC